MKKRYETIITEIDEGILKVTLNRPERMNALSYKMIEEITECFLDDALMDEVKAVVLTGGDEVFCVGADLHERSEMASRWDRNGAGPVERTEPLRRSRRMFSALEDCTKPVVAAMAGYALGGGCELALCCDLRIADSTLKIGLTEARLGAIPSGGGTQRLPRLIGLARAKEMLLMAEPIDAEKALNYGLVNELVEKGHSMQRAMEVAGLLSNRAPLSCRMIKLALHRGMQMDLESALDLEHSLSAILSVSKDLKEGREAFVQKRKPKFKGK